MQFVELRRPKYWLMIIWSALTLPLTIYVVFYPLFPDNTTLQGIMAAFAMILIFGAWILLARK